MSIDTQSLQPITNSPYGTSCKEDQKELNVGTAKKIEINDSRFNLEIESQIIRISQNFLEQEITQLATVAEEAAIYNKGN